MEADAHLDGHAHTATFEGCTGQKVNLDIGFMAMNPATHPNFNRFLREVGIETKKIQVTYSVSRDQGIFEWANTSISSMIAQSWNILRLGMWRMIFDVLRFKEFALDVLQEEPNNGDDPASGQLKRSSTGPAQETIAEYLDRENYSQEFRDDYLFPLAAAMGIISPGRTSLDFPAVIWAPCMVDLQLYYRVTISTYKESKHLKGISNVLDELALTHS